jgi:hypothetical protein
VNGYKDRHYIKNEFTELADGIALAKEKGSEVVLLDLGCGVGNAFYPLVNEFGCPPIRI